MKKAQKSPLATLEKASSKIVEAINAGATEVKQLIASIFYVIEVKDHDYQNVDRAFRLGYNPFSIDSQDLQTRQDGVFHLITDKTHPELIPVLEAMAEEVEQPTEEALNPQFLIELTNALIIYKVSDQGRRLGNTVKTEKIQIKTTK